MNPRRKKKVMNNWFTQCWDTLWPKSKLFFVSKALNDLYLKLEIRNAQKKNILVSHVHVKAGDIRTVNMTFSGLNISR